MGRRVGVRERERVCVRESEGEREREGECITSCCGCRCTVCQTPLPESYYAVEDQPYCMDHFYETTAHKCQACGNYITGPTMVSTQ